MTLLAFEAQESWLPTVTGLVCAAIHLDETLLQLHLGEVTIHDSGDVDAERTVSLNGVWRVEQDAQVVAGSGDLDESRTRDALAILTGTSLERFEVTRPGFELDLYFSGAITLRCFPCQAAEFDPDDDEEDLTISWWIDGHGVPDDWEGFNDPQGI